MSASLSSSEGCAVKPPGRRTQLALPPWAMPKGLRTSAWNTTDTANMGIAATYHQLRGTREAAMATITATTMMIAGLTYSR